ncbi:MAG: hypothetical protein ACXVJD_12275 [Mucilaginibacter sp.]
MIIPKNISISFALLCLLLFSCKEYPRIDLAKLTFTEKAESVISYDDKYFGGVNTMEAPLAFALQATKSSAFAFNGLKIDSAFITFLLRSDKIRKDTSLYQGGATADQGAVTNRADLLKMLKKFQADSVIYGYRLGIKTEALQSAILKELIKLYGQGTKTPATDHGLYWNLKAQHRFVFYAPDYRDLLVVDNTHLSKNCFWDPSTGNVDLGGCNLVQYKSSLLK